MLYAGSRPEPCTPRMPWSRRREAPCNLVSLATFRALLHKCPCKGGADGNFSPLVAAFAGCPHSRCCGHHSQGDPHKLDESRLCPTSHLTQNKCPPAPLQSNQNPEQKGRTRWKGSRQTVYPYAARVEQASFIFLVGAGEISGGFHSS